MSYVTVYAKHMPSICLKYVRYMFVISLQRPPCGPFVSPKRAGVFRPGQSADDPFCFCNQKHSNSRLGPAKIPQPYVDLVNMAAPAWCKSLTVCTAGFEGKLSLCCVPVRNGRGGIVGRKQGKSSTRPRKSSTLPTECHMPGLGLSWARITCVICHNVCHMPRLRLLYAKITFVVWHSICEEYEKEAYTHAKMQVLTVQHGLQTPKFRVGKHTPS
jgi:hypothetical protein